MIHNKILLVDDDSDDQLIFTDAVKEVHPHIECISINNGFDALEHLAKVSPLPSLIFLDLNMPKMNGFECLAEIKKINKFKEIPVVIYTTSNHSADKEKAFDLGADFFLSKPGDFNILKSKLVLILEIDFKKDRNL